jgi:hypothetical protein
MVSEDSDQLMPGLPSVHRLCDLRDVRKTRVGQVDPVIDHCDTTSELLEVAPLRRMQWMSREERDDRLDQVAPTTHHVPTQVLSVIVVSPVGDHASHSEKALKLPQARDALCALCHSKLVSHLIAGLVAFPARSRWLPNEPDGEATLSVYKTDNPAKLDQSFLLISCTRHIVTVSPTWDAIRSAGFSGVPAYGQMLSA